jgi:hypothetical protein
MQAIAHAWKHQCITGILAYFYYMRIADTIHSLEPEDHDIIDRLP